MKYLSFSSPKGGVGRTLTLANCAKIYSNGCDWAGIEPSITVLADLDFHAPGIHYYNFATGESKTSANYCTFYANKLTHSDLLADLETNRAGLLFLLSDILKDAGYRNTIEKFARHLKENKQDEGQIYNDLNDYISGFLDQREFDPGRHMIYFNKYYKNLFIFPAASPNHTDFNSTVFNFNWLDFYRDFGLFLLDGIFIKATQIAKKRVKKDLPVRVLTDQQTGVSVPSILNRTLADAVVMVSGLNRQNKIGLEGLIESYCSSFGKNPWIVLNQYNFRKIALKSSLDLNGDQKSPHEEFRAVDNEERVKFVKQICRNNTELKKNIFVTEFITEAIQREHFYNEKELATSELVRMIVSIERSFLPEQKKPQKQKGNKRIVFIGEKVYSGNQYSGPLSGIYKLLTTFFPSTIIIALAVKHEDIIALSNHKMLSGYLSQSDEPGVHFSLEDIKESNIYDFEVHKGANTIISVHDLDFISYPHHLKSTLSGNQLIKVFTEDEFSRNMPTCDSLKGSSIPYYKEHILRWKEYIETDELLIDSVPLFVNFQLLAYHRNSVLDKPEFKSNYRRTFLRNFEGFRNPQDLLDFAKLTGMDNRADNNVLLCGNPDNIAMWYEWQTIFSLFYDISGKPPAIRSIESYRDFLLTDDALRASLIYLKLLNEVELTKADDNSKSGYDWDKLIQDFYIRENKSLIFIWPDAIPMGAENSGQDARTDNSIIYQVPPSFHLFEECWQFSIVEKEYNDDELNGLLEFINYYLTPKAQEIYTLNGGMPTHMQVLSSLDIWNKYPFIPAIWSIYSDPKYDDILAKRSSFDKNYETGKVIAKCLFKTYQTHRDKNDKETIEYLADQLNSAFNALINTEEEIIN